MRKARVRLICIIAGALLAAFLVPLAVKAWSASQQISSNDPACGEGMHRYPALAAQGSNVYVMWSKKVTETADLQDPHDPYYDQSSDNGQNWGTDTEIQGSLSTDAYAPLDLTIDITGSLHFVWVEAEPPKSSITFTLYYSYTDASSGVQTITQTIQKATQPAMEVSSGDVHVVWAQGDDWSSTNILYHSKSIGTGAWSGSPTFIDSSSDPSYHPDIAIDGDDDLHVVWERWDDMNMGIILYKKRTSGVWSTDPITISTGITNSHRPAIAVYSDTVNVVWCEYIDKDTQYVQFRQSTDGGSNWDASERISGDDLAVNLAVSTYLLPAITVDSNGKIHVAFNGQSDNPAEDIHYVSRVEGGNWSARQNVTDSIDNATAPAIATAGEDVHLAWAEKRSGSPYDVYYSRAGILGGHRYLPLMLKKSSP